MGLVEDPRLECRIVGNPELFDPLELAMAQFLADVLIVTDCEETWIVDLAQRIGGDSPLLEIPWVAALWGAGDEVETIRFARRELVGAEVCDDVDN